MSAPDTGLPPVVPIEDLDPRLPQGLQLANGPHTAYQLANGCVLPTSLPPHMLYRLAPDVFPDPDAKPADAMETAAPAAQIVSDHGAEAPASDPEPVVAEPAEETPIGVDVSGADALTLDSEPAAEAETLPDDPAPVAEEVAPALDTPEESEPEPTVDDPVAPAPVIEEV